LSAAGSSIGDGRSCADCTLCCKLVGVVALAKPRNVECEHCDVGKGCRIYDARPGECARYNCSYVINEGIGAHWKPLTSHMVLTHETAANRIMIYVDQAHTGAWRQEPYFSDIKRWAVDAVQNAGQVVVWEGLNAVVIFPDREKEMGPVQDGQILVTGKRRNPSGSDPVFDAFLMESNDPKLGQLQAGSKLIVDK